MTNPPQSSNITITKDSAFSVKINRFLALLQRLLSNPTTVIGLIIIGLMLSMAIFAPWITTANIPDPYQMPRDWGAVRKPPGEMGYLLGTTNEVVTFFTVSFGVAEPHYNYPYMLWDRP